ncbi:aldehyde dehydrogenase family protein, partial [Pseudoclavibacter helvolus]
MTDTALPTIQHWINGAFSTATPARTSPVFNPALGTATSNVALADDAEINAAIAAAKAAFPGWSNTSIAKRQNIIFKFRELLNERKFELARIITSEHGKVVSDAAGEIQRGLEVVELATGFPHIMKGDFTENASTGVDVFSIKQALGVVGIISPFNFPAM